MNFSQLVCDSRDKETLFKTAFPFGLIAISLEIFERMTIQIYCAVSLIPIAISINGVKS